MHKLYFTSTIIIFFPDTYHMSFDLKFMMSTYIQKGIVLKAPYCILYIPVLHQDGNNGISQTGKEQCGNLPDLVFDIFLLALIFQFIN